MNCFQICIFVLWQTTYSGLARSSVLLWIAFKFVSLSYDKQHERTRMLGRLVVNCFQICIFVLWQTTLGFRQFSDCLLWIAFKFVSLSYDKQRKSSGYATASGCELLSNLYLCPMTNNRMSNILLSEDVVNCFQICIFVLWQTTRLVESVDNQ